MKLLHGIFAFLFVLLVLMLFLWDMGFGQVANVWAVDETEKVQRDNLGHFMKETYSAQNAVWKNGDVNIFGMRNETVGFQILLENQTASQITNMDVTLDTLTLDGGGYHITNAAWDGDLDNFVGRNIEIFMEHYMDYPVPSVRPPLVAGALPPAADYSGWLPDGLFPKQLAASDSVNDIIKGMPFHIKANRVQGVWVDIYIPKAAPAGNYTGKLRIKEWGALSDSLTVKLEVYGGTLSDSTHTMYVFHTGEWTINAMRNGIGVAKASGWGGDSTISRYRALAKMGHRHRVSHHGSEFAQPTFETYILPHYTGSLYTAANNYSGPGVGIGDNVFFIGLFEFLISRGPPLTTVPRYIGRYCLSTVAHSRATNNQANNIQASNWWAQLFADSCPQVYLAMNIYEEPPEYDWNGDGYKDWKRTADQKAADSTIMWQAGRTVTDWIQGGGGIGASLKMNAVGQVYRRYSPNQADNSSQNRIHHYYVTGGGGNPSFPWGRDGFHLRTTQSSPNPSNSALEENVSQAFGDGDVVGMYNGGWPAWGSIETPNLPLMAQRVPMWVRYRYGADTIHSFLNWECAFNFGLTEGNSTNYFVSPGTIRPGDGTLLYPGVYGKYPAHSGSYQGFMPSMRYKNIRRGIQDYEYFWLAESLGVPTATLQTIVKKVVPRALDDFGGNYTNWDDTWPYTSLRGYAFEAVRRELADTIRGRLGGAPPQPWPSGTFTASPTSLSEADSVGFSWSNVQYTDSIYISHSKAGASSWRKLTYAVSGTDSIWISATTTVQLRLYGHPSDVKDSVLYQEEVVIQASTPEKITNGGFEDTDITVAWMKSGDLTLSRSTASPTINTAKASCVLGNPIGAYTQLYSKTAYSWSMVGGQQYRLRFAVYSTSAAQMRVRILKNADPYTNYGYNKLVDFGTSAWTRIDTVFTCSATGTVSDAYIQFLFDWEGTDYATPGSTVFIDSISLIPYTGTSLSAPVISSPSEGATEVDTVMDVVWSHVTGRLGYHVYMDTLANFSTQWGDTVGVADNSASFFGLAYSKLHYTRVRAYDNYGNGPFSDTVSFTTRAAETAPSGTPILSIPRQRAKGKAVDGLSLTWSAVQGAILYEYQVVGDTNEAVNDTVWTTTATIVLAGTMDRPALTYKTDYFWRVRGRNTAGAGPWSAWSQFRTGAEEALRARRRF